MFTTVKVQTKLSAEFQWSFLLNPLKRNLGITESCLQRKKITVPMISPGKPYVKASVLNDTFLQRKYFGHLWFLYRKVSLFYT